MRRPPLLAVLVAAALAGLGLAVLPALAVDQTVNATSSNDFTPSAITIDVGDTVTWNNIGGEHNVHFDDGSFDQPANPADSRWTVQRTFNTPGGFSYVCEEHSNMTGTVTVNAAGPGSGTGTQTDPDGPGPGPGSGPGPGGDSTRPSVTRFALSRTRFRVGGDATARGARKRTKRGSAFRFRLSEAADVRIAIARAVRRGGRTRYVARGSLRRRNLDAGPASISFSGRIGRAALAAAAYRATITATDDAGNRSLPKRASFRVVRR
jgi:plastocyanin